MTHALHRFTAALFGWIPDLSGIPARRQATLGIAASIILHVLLIVLIALFIREKAPETLSFAKPKIKPRSVELVIQPPEPELEPEPIMPFTMAPPMQPFMDSRGLDIAREAALNPIFQADENMRAASESPATGDAPLPSQEGRDRPFNAFTTQRSLLGMSAPTPFESAPEVPSAPAPPPVEATPPAEQTPPPALAKTAPEPEPVAPPPPKETMKEVITPKDDEIVLSAKAPPAAITRLEPVPQATPAPPATPVATPRPVEQQARLTTPAPRPQTARESGYQPEQEQNRIEGNITNRGRKSVDAIATPLAKYRKQVNDAIGSRWYYYVKDPQRMSLIAPGSAKISFYIDAQGQVSGIQLEGNTSNESFADLCRSAIRDAREQIKELKLPVDAMMPLKDGRLECSLTFTFYNL